MAPTDVEPTEPDPALEKLRANLNYPDDLPIVARRDELVAAIRDHQVLIVAGETGSGKSTQLPKFCVEAGRGTNGLIGHTQPRRLAARSIAERIADETNTEVGDQVGFAVRFNDRVGDTTRIKVMTDGILLAELQRDRKLSRYDTIIIDEAHERSLNIDFILGYLKNLLPRRPDLHIIITSATIDTQRFSAHFDDAPIIEVSGRSYPVEIRYRPLDGDGDGHVYGDDGPLNQVDGIARAVDELRREGPGDILVFLAGERDIRETAKELNGQDRPDTEIFPLYARLSSAEQHRVFQPHRGRRIVLATNVAETSVTVPGIRYVIDAGNARISRYNQRTKVQRLPIEEISQASANQRAGRCGRIGPGVCIRLYSEDDFEDRPEFTEPEIQRTNLASVILQMASLGLGDIARFPFVDPPDQRSITDGIRLLEELHALDPDHEFTRRWLTTIGRELARLPVDPRFGRMIIEAADHGGLDEVLIITAGLSIIDPREYPRENEGQAAESHARFNDDASDFITLLNLWRYLNRQRKALSSNRFRKLCRAEYINYNRVREWQDTHRQLRRTARELGYTGGSNRAEPSTIHRALLAGLLSHVGMKDPKAKQPNGGARSSGRDRQPERRARAEYLGARGSRFVVGRRSVVAKASPNWLMAAELVETNRMWATMAAPIDPRWAEDLADHLVTRSYGPPQWNPDDGVATCVESITLYGLPLVSGRRITVGRVNPELARELFIHHALVEGDWATHHDFVDHNRELIADVEELETRGRRRDLLVEQQRLHAFFEARVPADVVSGGHFNRWWKKASSDEPNRFRLSPGDLLADDANPVDTDHFPDTWTLASGAELELAYTFDPTSHLDGVSVHVPIEVLPQLDADPFTWSVPGQRTELVAALIRSLPKQLRKTFGPTTDAAVAIAPDLDPDGGAITRVLADTLGKRHGLIVPVDQFDWGRVPGHLRPTFRVINAERELLAEGKDLAAVRELLADKAEAAVAELSAGGVDLERSGIVSWDFGDLPAEVVSEADGHRVVAYPSLVDDGSSVSIRFTTSPDEQADNHWEGVRRLLRNRLHSPVKTLDRLLTNSTKMALLDPPAQSKAQWYNDAITTALDHVMARFGPPPLTAAGFEELVEQAKGTFRSALEATASTMGDLVERSAAIDAQLAALAGARFDASVRDAGAHFARLAHPGFMEHAGQDRLGDIARYLAALEHRLGRMAENPTLDLSKAAECVAVENRHRELVARLGPTDELVALGWELEELRVAAFAQHLRSDSGAGTSARKLQRAMSALARVNNLD